MKYETIDLTEDVRKEIGSAFILLSNGMTHYEMKGSKQGEVVILVHGFSSPLFVWDFVFPELVKNGFRTLRYDLYGRGFSDRPIVTYDLDLFDKQLFELIKALELPTPVNLVGLSMGGGICALFADRHDELVKKVTFIDTIGFDVSMGILQKIIKVPVVNRIIISFMTHQRLINGVYDDFTETKGLDEYLEKYKEQMKYRGFLRAIRSTALNVPFTGMEEIFRHLEEKQIPMQLFWGKQDQVIPFKATERALTVIPSTSFHPIENCGHQPQYSKPEEVNPLLIEFLRKKVSKE